MLGKVRRDGRLPIGQGTGAGLTPRVLGAQGGAESVSLTPSSLPAHTHALNAAVDAATTNIPDTTLFLAATPSSPGDVFYFTAGATGTDAVLSSQSVSSVGSSQAHNNIMPCLGINFIISLKGMYPQQQ